MGNPESHLCAFHGNIQGGDVVDGPRAECTVHDHEWDSSNQACLRKCARESQHDLPNLWHGSNQSASSCHQQILTQSKFEIWLIINIILLAALCWSAYEYAYSMAVRQIDRVVRPVRSSMWAMRPSWCQHALPSRSTMTLSPRGGLHDMREY